MFKNLRGIWTVAEREVLAVIQTKTFWLFAAAYPLLIGAPFLLVPLSSSISSLIEKEETVESAWQYEYFSSEQKEMLQKFFFGDAVKFSIEDKTGKLYKHIRYEIVADGLKNLLPTTVADLHRYESEEPRFLEGMYDFSGNMFDEILWTEDSSESLDDWLENKQIAGYFVIPENLLTSDEPIRFIRDKSVSLRLSGKIEKLKDWFLDIVQRATHSYLLETVGVEPGRRPDLLQGIDISIERVKPEIPVLATAETPLSSPFLDTNLYKIASVVFVVFFILVLTGTSNAALTSTLEEKSNRLSEILVSNVDAAQVLDGKLLANAIIALIGISVFCLVNGSIFGSAALYSDYVAEFLSALLHPIKVINWFLFLLLGIAFFGYVEIALGSLCNNTKETMMTLYPVRFFYTFGVLPVMFFVVSKPSGDLAELLSFVPPFTPYVMIARSDSLPNWPSYLLSVALMIIGVFLVRRYSKSLFANGLLLEQTTSTLGKMLKLARRAP